MLGELNNEQIESLLTRQLVGRLGCHNNGETYIVPVNYVYRNGAIYIHSGPGKKIDMMRKNPSVCFEVDDIQNVFKWQCVILWGLFEELTDMDEKEQAMQALTHRIMPLVNSPADHPSHGITQNEYDIGTKIDLILYRIKIVKTSGRFEG